MQGKLGSAPSSSGSSTVKESPTLVLRRSAMGYLARREHSFHELVVKLCKKYPESDPDELIIPVVNILQQENLQSDQRYVESYVRYRSSRGIGPLKICNELNLKKASSNLINTEVYSSSIDWRQLCLQAMHKKFSSRHSFIDEPQEEDGIEERINSKASLKLLQRKQRFLIQRGFSNEDIRAVIKSRLDYSFE